MMSRTKKLSVAFYWHMHQPVYQIAPAGDYLMPWARLHAIKDYLDMVTVLDKFKHLKLNFNLVPVLLDSIIDYAENNLDDIHSKLTVKPIDELNDDDKLFIVNNFFDANYQSMIFPLEEYNRLYQTYGIGYYTYGRNNEVFWSGDVSGRDARCIAWMPLPSPFVEKQSNK